MIFFYAASSSTTAVLPHGEWIRYVTLHQPCGCCCQKINMANELLALFAGIGLSEQKAKETLKNQNVSENLTQVIHEVCMWERWLFVYWFYIDVVDYFVRRVAVGRNLWICAIHGLRRSTDCAQQISRRRFASLRLRLTHSVTVCRLFHYLKLCRMRLSKFLADSYLEDSI